MDKYDATDDRYCYAGTGVLRNKLNIRSMDALEDAEREVTALTARKIRFGHPPYGLRYMQELHRILFFELYDWAGNIRDVDISKGGTRFCHCTRVEAESTKLFGAMQREGWLKGLNKHDFCQKLAEYYCEINMLHPFREGNGRTQRILFEHLALSAGYDLDWSKVSPDEWMPANIDGVHVNYTPMQRIFNRIVTACG